MADQKISQLAGGGAALATDEVPIARSGANYKITGANIAAAATSVGTLTSLTVSGNVTVNTNTFFVDTVNNRIGIGITSPTISPLQAEADADANRGLYVRNINTGTAAFGFVAAASLVGALELRAYSAANSVWPNRAVLNSGSGFTNGLAIVANGATPIEMWTNGTRRLTVDSAGNLGLGTNTPSFLLDINGNSRTRGELYVFNTSGTDRLTLAPQATGSGGKLLAVNAANNAYTPLLLDGSVVQLQTSAVTRLTLDANGNLGLGVTPSAWGGYTAFQLGGGAVYGIASRRIGFSANAFGPSFGNFTYVSTNPAGRYEIDANTHQWYIAPSGTSGTAVTFTQAMTLDANGNLGLGTTSMGEPLHVARGAGTTAFAIFAGGGAGAASAMMYGQDTVGNGYVWNRANASVYFGTNSLQQMRLDASGNLGIGVTPSVRLHVATETAGTNDIVEVARIQRFTSGTAAVGLGAGINFMLERADGGNDVAARVSGVWSNATSGVATGYLRFDTATNGNFTERMRVDATVTAGQTALLLWDVDNGTLERVTVGAADSGGVGFKVLRIPN